MFQKLVFSLREWFDSVCKDHCNGYNNLYAPQLTCGNNNTGIIDSVVYYEGEMSAQMLIDMAIAEMHTRQLQPPVIYLSHGWILQHLNHTLHAKDHEQMEPSSSLPTVTEAGCGATIAAAILLLNI